MDEEDAARQLEVDMERDVVTCEMPFGSVLFLNNIIPHRQAGRTAPYASDETCSSATAVAIPHVCSHKPLLKYAALLMLRG